MSPNLAIRTLVIAAGLVAGLFLGAGCDSRKSGPQSAAQPQTTDVYTTFYPTEYFARRIAGDHVKVVNPCPPDADPAFWMPDEQTIAAYQNAALIIINGASFEKWVDKVTLPEARIVETAKPFADEFIVLTDAVTHSHGPAGAHTHEGIDGHTWLDPVNARIQAGEITRALVRQVPDHEQDFVKGYGELGKDLEALGARLKAVSEKMHGHVLLCSHPAYNYIGRRYGWQLKSFHLDPEEMPAEAVWQEIKDFRAQQPAKHMLWEAPPTDEIAAAMRALGLENIVFSPAESLDAEQRARGEDYLSVMNQNVARLEETFGD